MWLVKKTDSKREERKDLFKWHWGIPLDRVFQRVSPHQQECLLTYPFLGHTATLGMVRMKERTESGFLTYPQVHVCAKLGERGETAVPPCFLQLVCSPTGVPGYYLSKGTQGGRPAPVRQNTGPTERYRVGALPLWECSDHEPLLGGTGGISIRYSKFRPLWPAFWSNYMDLWNLKKCMYFLFSFSMDSFKTRVDFFFFF